MASLKSQLMYWIARNRHLFKGQFKRPVWDTNPQLVTDFRQMCEDGAAMSGKIPETVAVEALMLEGMKAEWIRPVGVKTGAAIFYLHGGGYISGSCSDHRHHVAKVVLASAVPALQFEYRLAPEHPYPAAFDDGMAAYRWMLAQGHNPGQIVIAGDSAGAGLTLALLLGIRDQGLPLPAAAVASSPWTDLLLTGDSYLANRYRCLSPLDMAVVCSRYYFGEHDPADPYISPLYGDLRGLPPLLIMAGSDETMRDDAVSFAEKARQAGVDVTLRVAEGMGHCYPFMAPMFPEAIAGMAEIGAFCKNRLGIM
jgi:monoterpene epsilon-lactone hydrolase